MFSASALWTSLRSGDVVVIAKGASVTGSVVALGGKRNFFGERSKVRFRLISADSVDDAKINVRATPAAKSDGVETRSFETPNGSKDKSLIAAHGTEYVAYVTGDQTVHVPQIRFCEVKVPRRALKSL